METPQVTNYQIILKGHFEGSWVHVFADLEVVLESSGNTRLCGAIDQARLHSLLRAFRDGGIIVISLNLISCSKEE